MLLLSFNWKNFLMFIFSLFFYSKSFLIVNIENPAPFSLNFSSPMTYSSKERSSYIARSLQPHPKPKRSPLKTSVHFPITITVCKHWSKVCNLQPLPQGLWGSKFPQRHSYYGFRLCGKKWLSQNFYSLTLGKNERGRGPRCPPIFLSLKKGIRTFHFRPSEPACDILWPLGRYDDPGEKKIKNK